MNIYAVIILVTIIAGFILDITAELLNLKNLGKGLPDEFKDVYDEQKYLKSQEYTRVRTKFGFVTTAFSLVLLLAFWFSGGFNYLDILVRGWLESSILRGLAYIGILVLGNAILSMPFSIYSTFVIEEKFGFNKTTPKTFVLDLAKSLLLSVLIGAPVLAAILYILEFTGDYAWLYGWGAVVLISLALQYIAPTWIMPLFNKFKPLEEGDLRSSIIDYARSVKFPLKNVFVIDGSRRSTKSNAYFTGFGRNKRIALFDTLIARHTVRELVSVLAHEIGHYKKKHLLKGMLISIVHTGVLFFLLSVFLNARGLYEAFYMQHQPLYAGLLFFGLLYSPAEMILSLFLNVFSRKHEYEADRFAAETTGQPEDMVSALKKLSEHNLSNLTPHPFYVFLHYSHPPVLDRIKAIRDIKQDNIIIKE